MSKESTDEASTHKAWFEKIKALFEKFGLNSKWAALIAAILIAVIAVLTSGCSLTTPNGYVLDISGRHQFIVVESKG